MDGSLVRTLINGERETGAHVATWNGRNDAGDLVGSGVYFYRIEAAGSSATKKMVFVK